MSSSPLPLGRFVVSSANTRSFDLEGIEFRAMNPVSTRRADQRGALGNQVAMWLVTLPVDDPNPASRLAKIKAETSKLKADQSGPGGRPPLVELSRGTPLTIISLANRVVGPMMRPFNLTVTNVPGPQFPMYLLEAPMLANYPIVPLWSQHGLGSGPVLVQRLLRLGDPCRLRCDPRHRGPHRRHQPRHR